MALIRENYSDEIESLLINAKKQQLSLFRHLAAKLEAFNPGSFEDSRIISFTFNDIATLDKIIRLAKDLPGQGKYLYYFSTENFQEILRRFPQKTDKEIKYTRFNKVENSKNIYVGSSNCLRKRFEEHCGKVGKATYAIKFSNWLQGTDFPIHFHYFQLNDIDQDLLQILEDALWKELKPMLGKPGGNNKQK